MRALIVVAVIALVLVLVGWLKFSSPDGNPTIQIDKTKVKEDTSSLVEKSKDAVDRAAESVDESIDREPAAE